MCRRCPRYLGCPWVSWISLVSSVSWVSRMSSVSCMSLVSCASTASMWCQDGIGLHESLAPWRCSAPCICSGLATWGLHAYIASRLALRGSKDFPEQIANSIADKLKTHQRAGRSPCHQLENRFQRLKTSKFQNKEKLEPV